ncbi:MAG: iron-sulfur cluster assembly scaffold protein [Deltaproteobacteria bacterium]|nr:iron-sulfur cluster assembly scaffold protein [Deltaproteobacteria bacterium]MBW2650533.1 iron-sulfur cluster assembly scaffold protein [Deltaproteobacteria bacterium]
MENNREIEEIMMGMVYEKAMEIYSEALIEHGTNPRNHGTIDHPDGYAKITGPCGDTVEMFLRMKDKKIEESKFNTDGCIFSIAACSIAAEMAEGKTVPECIGINQSAILGRLEKMPKDHEHCALLAAMTFQKALKQCIGIRGKDQ